MSTASQLSLQTSLPAVQRCRSDGAAVIWDLLLRRRARLLSPPLPACSHLRPIAHLVCRPKCGPVAKKDFPLLHVCAPGLHFASLMGKFGPWKVALGESWRAVFRSDASSSTCPSKWSQQSLLFDVRLRSLQFVEVSVLFLVNQARSSNNPIMEREGERERDSGWPLIQ